MSEYEYFTNSPYTNFCKEEGYYKGLEDIQHIHRFAAYRIHQSLVKKPLTLEKFWAIEVDKNPIERKTFTPKEWEELKRVHGLK